jgi:hypothetical protein
MPQVLFFGMPVACLVCSADVINGGMMTSRVKSKKLGERPVPTKLHPPGLLIVRVEPLLCNDSQIGGYNGAVSRQRLLGSRVLIMQQLDYKNGRALFSVWSVPRCYKQGTRLYPISSVQESVKRALERGKLKNRYC